MKDMIEVEYAVEAPGRGYIGFSGNVVEQEPRGFNNFTDAERVWHSMVQKYKSVGCPEVGDTLRIVSRTIKVSFGDWGPVQ